MIPQYKETYEKLLSLTNLCEKNFSDSKAELKKSMKRTELFLETLGSPHKKLNIIHIAGTSGKGSVAFMLHQMFTADNQNVGTYLSPHTTTYLERFSYNDKLLGTDQLTGSMSELIEKYQKYLEKQGTALSFFELSTCLALFAFHKAGAKWCVLETGCGGRWDATNVIPTPKAAIITNIDKDHTELLGNSLAQIAYEKAGIIKKNGTIFCGEVRPKIKKVFMEEAIKNNAALFFIHPPFENIIDADHGEHQQHNASLAVAAAKEVGISDKAIEKVLENLKRPPCRFETVQESPRIILDGAHSPAKIAATVKKIKSLKKPVHLIFGCAANKDAAQMLKQLAPHVARVTTTRFQMSMRKAALPSELLKTIPKTKRAGAFIDSHEALEAAKSKLKKNEIIIATGSLFLAGELRENWISEDQILKSASSFI